jgi:hypothetical protein
MSTIQQQLGHRSAYVASSTGYQNLHAFTFPSCTLIAEPSKGRTVKQRKALAAIHIVGFLGDANGVQRKRTQNGFALGLPRSED